MQINTEAPVKFALSLRIPTWCRNAGIKINGTDEDMKLSPGTFVKLVREFRQGDYVTLTLPMELQLIHWEDGGIAIERGPLVYSLRIEEDWQRNMEGGSTVDDFPAWNLYPASQWNYALAVGEDTLEKDTEVIYHDMSPEPWSIYTAPVELCVPARTVEGWDIEKRPQFYGRRGMKRAVLWKLGK